MKRVKHSAVLILVLVVLPDVLQAHVGHGFFEETLIHYLTSAIHWMPVAVIFGLIICYMVVRKSSISQRN